MLKATVTENESTNSVLKVLTHRAPNINLPLLSSRVCLKSYLGIGNSVKESKARFLQIKTVGEVLLQTCLEHKSESKGILDKGDARWDAPIPIQDVPGADAPAGKQDAQDVDGDTPKWAEAHDLLLFRECNARSSVHFAPCGVTIGTKCFVVSDLFFHRTFLVSATLRGNAVVINRPMQFTSASKVFVDFYEVATSMRTRKRQLCEVVLLPLGVDSADFSELPLHATMPTKTLFTLSCDPATSDVTTKMLPKKKTAAKMKTQAPAAPRDDAAVPPPAPIDDRDLLAEQLEHIMETHDGLSMSMISEVMKHVIGVTTDPTEADLLNKEDQQFVDNLEAHANHSVKVALGQGQLHTHEVVRRATKLATDQSSVLHGEDELLQEAALTIMQLPAELTNGEDNADCVGAALHNWRDAFTSAVKCLQQRADAAKEKVLGDISLMYNANTQEVAFIAWDGGSANALKQGRRVTVDAHQCVSWNKSYAACFLHVHGWRVVHPAIGCLASSDQKGPATKKAKSEDEGNVPQRPHVSDDVMMLHRIWKTALSKTDGANDCGHIGAPCILCNNHCGSTTEQCALCLQSCHQQCIALLSIDPGVEVSDGDQCVQLPDVLQRSVKLVIVCVDK